MAGHRTPAIFWNLQEVRLAYTAQKNTGKRYGELLILNFDPADASPAKQKPEPIVED